MTSGVLEFNGTACTIRFHDFGQPLHVQLPHGESVSLPPWSYQDHIDGLRMCVTARGAELALDDARFATCVLERAGISASLHAELTPVALWWAAGGDATFDDPPDADGWLGLGQVGVRLRPWSERERMAALLACMIEEPGGVSRFDVAGYLDAMTRASVLQLDPDCALDALDSHATALLLNAVVSCNVAEPILSGTPAARESASRTLRLCQALGWTPSQVWAVPAGEVDRLLALLDIVQQHADATPSPPVPVRTRRGLADMPDAVVIRIEDDEA